MKLNDGNEVLKSLVLVMKSLVLRRNWKSMENVFF